jgi:branched-subunit amino acid aminotransferase/4-amino-4-deoxychorismate lyase
MANFAKKKGGYQGLKLDKEGNILEAAMANIATITKKKEFLITPTDHILEG